MAHQCFSLEEIERLERSLDGLDFSRAGMIEDIVAANKAIIPRPISEAPANGDPILLFEKKAGRFDGPILGWYVGGKYPWAFIDDFTPWEPGREWHGEEFPDLLNCNAFSENYGPTHFIELSDIPKPPPTTGEGK